VVCPAEAIEQLRALLPPHVIGVKTELLDNEHTGALRSAVLVQRQGQPKRIHLTDRQPYRDQALRGLALSSPNHDAAWARSAYHVLETLAGLNDTGAWCLSPDPPAGGTLRDGTFIDRDVGSWPACYLAWKRTAICLPTTYAVHVDQLSFREEHRRRFQQWARFISARHEEVAAVYWGEILAAARAFALNLRDAASLWSRRKFERVAGQLGAEPHLFLEALFNLQPLVSLEISHVILIESEQYLRPALPSPISPTEARRRPPR
jgi:hypothetical protein